MRDTLRLESPTNTFCHITFTVLVAALKWDFAAQPPVAHAVEGLRQQAPALPSLPRVAVPAAAHTNRGDPWQPGRCLHRKNLLWPGRDEKKQKEKFKG